MAWIPHWASPWWFLAMALLPLLAWRHHRLPPAALTFSRLPAERAGSWRLHLPFYLRLAALSLVLIALARPQFGQVWEESSSDGIDIQIALDVSISMAAEDFHPSNRLAVAKQVARDFVRGRPQDRIGVSIFSGGAATLSPLTTDHRMIDRVLQAVTLHTEPDGTAIGVALATAAARLRQGRATSRVIVLVTDGVNNSGEIDPATATALCRGLGIRVYTVGVGTQGSVPIPIRLSPGRTLTIEAQIDEALLARIAQQTGGQFFKATNAAALHRVFAQIDELETTPIPVRQLIRYREVFPPLLWLALLLLLTPLATTATSITAHS